MKSKSKLATTQWQCAHCDKQFKYDSERRRHEQSHVPEFECKVCSKRFSFLSALRRHEKQHERTGSVQCSKCGGKFRDETLLKRHMQYAHTGTYSCKKCSATFNSDSALRTHTRTHQPESERRYRCSFSGCRKTFNFPHHLKHHELTHTDDKQHFCNTCGKGFIQLHHLKIHLKTHEPDNWLPCTVAGCKKRFANEYARKRHLTTHRNKPSHIVSSDSYDNSVRKKIVREAVLCVSCGKMISRRQYEKHALKCVLREDKAITPEDLSTTFITSLTNKHDVITAIKLEENIEIDNNNDSNNIDKVNNEQLDIDEDIESDNIDNTISTCKTVLGGCIVTGDSELNSSCLCAQMISSDDYYDLVPKEVNNSDILTNENITNDTNVSNTIFTPNCKVNDIIDPNMCAGCECSKTCLINPKNTEDNYQMPEIEYRKDGTVKIKEIFDIDIDFDVKTKQTPESIKPNDNSRKEPRDLKFEPFNSCKDILGNCIVSGNSTMGEGCLCAKMSLDNQQMMQEIEDITPCPKNTWL